MYDHSLFMRTVAELGERFLAPHGPDAVLTDLTARLVEIFGLEAAGLTLAEGADPPSAVGFPAGTDALEQVGTEHRAGPCVEALRTGEPFAIADLDAYVGRWPDFCAAARDRGLASALGLPLRLGGESLGALALYAGKRREWSTDDQRTAMVLADVTTAHLIHASRLRRQEQLTEQLQSALESRTVIEQAKGLVAARKDVSVDDAFELIRRHARAHQVTVRAVSDAIVNLGLQV